MRETGRWDRSRLLIYGKTASGQLWESAVRSAVLSAMCGYCDPVSARHQRHAKKSQSTINNDSLSRQKYSASLRRMDCRDGGVFLWTPNIRSRSLAFNDHLFAPHLNGLRSPVGMRAAA